MGLLEKGLKKKKTASEQKKEGHAKKSPKQAVEPRKQQSSRSLKQKTRLPVQSPRKQPFPKKKGFDIASIKAAIKEELKGEKKTKTATTPSDRVSTGVPGLDQVMSGGFRKNTVNLVVGGPGSGKSTLCMQFLIQGIENLQENCLYISFEETVDEVLQDFKQFGWKLEEKIKKKQMILFTYTPEQVEKVLEAGGGSMRDVIESQNIKRVVIDSLTAFTLLHENKLAQRKACIQLFEAMKKWKCTSIMISEEEPDPEKRNPTVEEFEVDGVILLYNMRKGDIRERALEVFKMRGTQHSAKLFPLNISEEGLVIYPDQTIF